MLRPEFEQGEGPLPIATAPRDGTRVLIFVPPDQGEVRARRPDTALTTNDEWLAGLRGWFTAWYEGDAWHTGLRDCYDSYAPLDPPTHWMPLPEAPRE